MICTSQEPCFATGRGTSWYRLSNEIKCDYEHPRNTDNQYLFLPVSFFAMGQIYKPECNCITYREIKTPLTFFLKSAFNQLCRWYLLSPSNLVDNTPIIVHPEILEKFCSCVEGKKCFRALSNSRKRNCF